MKTVKFNDFFREEFCIGDYSNIKNIEGISAFFPKGLRGKNAFKKVIIAGCDDDTADEKTLIVGKDIYASIRKDALKIWSPYQIEFNDDTIGIFNQMKRIEEVIMKDGIVFNLTSLMETFADCKHLRHVEMHADCKNINSFQMMFFNDSSLENVILDFMNTEQVINMSQMFKGCVSLKKINGIEKWDVLHLTTAREMFSKCGSMKNIPIECWNTSSLRDMSYMFSSCWRLEKIPAEKWDVSSLVDAMTAFAWCSSLQSVDLSEWNTVRLENVADMFVECNNLQSVNLDNWDAFNIKDIAYMFKDCFRLENVFMSWTNKACITRAEGAFDGCEKLTAIDLSSISFERCTNVAHMFESCKSLTWIQNNWNMYPCLLHSVSMFGDCINLMVPDTSSWPRHDMFDVDYFL